MAVSDDVDHIVLYRQLPVWAHGYIWPFVLLYIALLGGWLYVFEDFVYLEAFFISVAAIGVLNIVTCLACVWSVHIRSWMMCRRVSTIGAAHLVKVVPTPNNGSTELVKIKNGKETSTNETIVWFRFQEVKYIFDADKKTFRPILFPVDHSAVHYTSWKGLTDNNEVENSKQKYGLNKLNVVLPDFWVLFKERATAPFFIFQVFCVGLWCLDEYWYYSVFTLVMLILFEVLLVKQQQRNLSEIKKMGSTPHLINVFRGGRWSRLSTDDLVPGDIVSLCRSRDGYYVPCDVLLLRGSCIVDESMLTGESVPQMKEPLESSILQDGVLDIERDGKLHVVFGGTMVVQNSPPSKGSGLKAPDNGCVGFVLRTGFNTSQGKLLRTILYGVKRVTANNLETFMFILFLLIFAIAASSYVWVKGSEDPDRNKYKLFLECTLILTSVVPPELPIELSLAVNTSLISLVKMGIYCTEPFRIPFGGKVDICCFDKTGTLTSEDLVVEGIAGLNSEPVDNDKPILTPPLASPQETQYVMASCHSLAMLDGELVGDPLEKAALLSVDWRISKGDTVTPVRGRRTSINIIHRFHFSSQLKRMSTVSQLTTPSSSVHIAAVKGAPEVIKKMRFTPSAKFKSKRTKPATLSVVPKDYDETYLKLARRGARVLALGYRSFGHLSMRDANVLKREEVEKDLQFVGFISISCPLKKHSKESIKILKDSSHHVVMITGDNPLTACHVAKELRIATKELLLLQYTNMESGNGEWRWEDVNGGTIYPLEREKRSIRQLGSKYDLTLTGDGISQLLSIRSSQVLRYLLPFVKVFARVSPKQKELIVNSYKSLGYHTLMCGDGTNDVGALKHAHVGVSLLSTVRIKKKTLPTQDNQERQEALTRSPIRHNKKDPTGTTISSSSQDLQAERRNKLLQELIKQSEESLQDPSLVRLGDASIASPFTSRETTIRCICQVIRQGRCTLVTTLQMFKILALNALVLAYSQSVLYLDGIKFSDAQATIQGMLLAGCFLFISRSKPLDTLSKERPLPNIFNIYTILTVIVQFLVHFSCLVYLVQEAKIISPPDDGFVDLEKEFEQNTLNSAVFLISVAMQVSNFAVNYKGRPFMMGLRENRPLLICLMITGSVVLALASGLFPDLCEYLEIVEFSDDFQRKLFIVLLGDFVGSYVADSILSFFFGTAKLRRP